MHDDLSALPLPTSRWFWLKWRMIDRLDRLGVNRRVIDWLDERNHCRHYGDA